MAEYDNIETKLNSGTGLDTVSEDKADVKLAFEQLTEKARCYDKLFNYYDGKHPATFLTERLRRLFAEIDVNFTENWCAVVVDRVLERLDISGFVVTGGEDVQVFSDELFEELNVEDEAEDLHEAALVTGEAFLIVGETVVEEVENVLGEIESYVTQVDVVFNDPRYVQAFYYKGRPKAMRMAAKWHEDDDGYLCIVLYYADRFEYWRSNVRADKVQSWRAFERDPEMSENEPNPYGLIPVFHFRNSRRTAKSELDNVIDPQSVVNKLLNDMMAAAEFGAFKQKYAITNQNLSEGDLQNDPGTVWELAAGDGLTGSPQVGQFDATDLANFVGPMDREVSVISAVTGTPKHYFVQGGELSGEALIAMEAPLNRKAGKRIHRYSLTWVEMWAFVLALHGQNVGRQAIKVKYERPETVQPLMRSSIRKSNKEAGMPLRATLRVEEGWSQKELDDLDEDVKVQADQDQKMLGESLLRLNAGQPG